MIRCSYHKAETVSFYAASFTEACFYRCALDMFYIMYLLRWLVFLRSLLTCLYFSRRLFRVTLEISRAECNIDVTPGTLAATDTCIGYHMTRFEASRNVILHTRYVSTCVGAGGGTGRGTKIKTKANLCGALLYCCYAYR
jgi:hypothetical protein